VTGNPSLLAYVLEQTTAICLAAIERDPYALSFVKEQTPDVCLAAVRKYGLVLEMVWEKTDAICLAAVQQNGLAIKYVPRPPSREVYLAAKRQWRSTLPPGVDPLTYHTRPFM
jgi:hypothetical protein